MEVTKMHCSGNDFCVIPFKEKTDNKSLAAKLCNRKLGVGADGMIVVKTEPRPEMFFYNADGTQAPVSGNGLICFTRYCYEHGLVKHGKLDILTGTGPVSVEIVNGESFECKVTIGKPLFANSMIYATDPVDCFGRMIDIDGVKVNIYSFFMGTIHTVIFVDSLDDEVLSIAEKIHSHKLFAKKTNVDFVKIRKKTEMDVKTYERGVGWTYASGTGCCAAVVAANKLGLGSTKVRCNLELGHLDIEINKKGIVSMTGPAVKLFTCNYEEEM